MAQNYDFKNFNVGDKKIIEYPEINPHKLIFYVKSAWQSAKKYNALDWKMRIIEVDNGVLIERLS